VTRKRSFPPVLGRAPRVLILGSLPGEASLRLGRYYGHPRNAFWDLLGAALGEDLRALSYPRRLSRLKARGVALWDVVGSARRAGSLDSAIRDEKHNPVLDLIRRSGVQAVFLNGRKAESSFRRSCPAVPPGTAVIVLPSSSPANASVPYARKRKSWSAIAKFLRT
jgi:hypoxanthine-DNA glycosylase